MTKKEDKRILVIEDEFSQRNALVDKLEDEGFDVEQARNGEEGLEKALSLKPDLVLLDIIMPKMDGMTVLEKLRQDEWGKSAKVIMLTNLTSPGGIAAAMESGSFDYLVKTDWKLSDIVAKIRSVLD